jgi:hypothetical protein
MANSLATSTPTRNMSAELRSLGVSWTRRCSLFFLLLSLVGCNRDNFMKLFGYDRASLMKRFTPPDDESLALRYVELVRQHRFEKVEELLDPSIKDGETRDTEAGMAEVFPTREPASIKTVDANLARGEDSSTTSITLEYEFAPVEMPVNGRTDQTSRSWLLAQVVVQTKDGVKTIVGSHVMPISMSVEATNDFTLLDKSLSQYAGLCLAILVSVFSLYVFVLCARTKMGKKKWIWLIPIAIGVCRFTVDWTTGQWFFVPWAVQLPPVIMFCSPYGPWVFHITAPLGAVAFLLLRKHLMRSRAKTSSLVHSTNTP